MALGLDEDSRYEAGEIRMQLGDALVIYTDGIVECEGPNRELFGEPRLEQLLAASRGASAAAMLANVRRAVDEFRGGTPVSDDLSMLVARRT
jgi:sigma-B regulation protein RsbU (phosphoserine phosphatase)